MNNQELNTPSPTTFRLEFSVSVSQDDGEPDDFITVYHGDVIAIGDDEEQKIGTISIYMVERGRAQDEGESLFEIMDCLNADSCDCFENLFDSETEELKPEVTHLCSEDRQFQHDLMLIERLELIPEHRGQGIGKSVALRIIQKFGTNCGVIACKPFPLQFTGLSARDKQPTGKSVAQKKVREFWQGVGFVRLPGTEYYVWPD
jgi:GNAT superfamily N-acetyltransferase